MGSGGRGGRLCRGSVAVYLREPSRFLDDREPKGEPRCFGVLRELGGRWGEAAAGRRPRRGRAGGRVLVRKTKSRDFAARRFEASRRGSAAGRNRGEIAAAPRGATAAPQLRLRLFLPASLTRWCSPLLWVWCHARRRIIRGGVTCQSRRRARDTTFATRTSHPPRRGAGPRGLRTCSSRGGGSCIAS